MLNLYLWLGIEGVAWTRRGDPGIQVACQSLQYLIEKNATDYCDPIMQNLARNPAMCKLFGYNFEEVLEKAPVMVEHISETVGNSSGAFIITKSSRANYYTSLGIIKLTVEVVQFAAVSSFTIIVFKYAYDKVLKPVINTGSKLVNKNVSKIAKLCKNVKGWRFKIKYHYDNVFYYLFEIHHFSIISSFEDSI